MIKVQDYRPQPFTDFTLEENRQAYQDALKKVRSELLGKQVVGVLIAIVYAAVITLVLGLLLKATIGLRASADARPSSKREGSTGAVPDMA